MSPRIAHAGTALVALAMSLALAGATSAAEAVPRVRWVSVSLLGGTAQPVSKLADYQWDVHPHAGWGAQALVGLGGWSVGPRLWRSGTSQALGLTGTPDPRVTTNVVPRSRERTSITTGSRS